MTTQLSHGVSSIFSLDTINVNISPNNLLLEGSSPAALNKVLDVIQEKNHL